MLYFDLHCDTPYECFKKKQEFYVNQLAVSGQAGEVFEKWVQTFGIWIKDDVPTPFKLYSDILSFFKQKLSKKPPNLTPLLAVEGGAVLEQDSDRLYVLKEDGISFLTLCWNGENPIAGGTKSDKGLTEFGKRVIEKMNGLKIGCDLSHLNRKSFYSAIEKADYPLATHSNSAFVCDHPRNLTDEQLKLIAEKGGIIGLCFYPVFLGDDVFEAVYRNIFHICEMELWDNIAIGSDFDGAQMHKRLDSIAKVPDLYAYLEGRGLGKGLLNKIFYENAYNFIAKLK